MIDIVNAKFLKSAQSIKDSIDPNFNEVVFMGRSNVGKSSFLNSLTNSKIAKTSSTPGKTRLINFFEVDFKKDNDLFKSIFVDLPGFGYAKVSKKEQQNWQKNLTAFIENRFNIKVFVRLVDARHPNLEIDENVKAYLENIKRPDQVILTVFTKIDKLKQSELAKLKKNNPDALFVSNLKNRGIKETKEKLFNILFGI